MRRKLQGKQALNVISWRYGEVFRGLDYPHDLSHDLSEWTVYIPSTSLCCRNQQRAITPSDHGVLVAKSLTKDSLLAAIQQRLSGMSNIINLIALFVCEIPSVPLIAMSWQRLVSVGPLFHCEHLCPRWCSSLECNLKPGTHWTSYRWDISSTRWNWIEKVFTWRVLWNDKEHSALVGHHLLDLLSTGKDCAVYIYTSGWYHSLARYTAASGRLRPSPPLISQVVIYLRHNPCYLHVYEEPIHNKECIRNWECDL
jgi:hypothetical protein